MNTVTQALRDAGTAKYAAERAYKDAQRDNTTPDRGEAVEVVRGRKVPVGTKGKLISTGESQYGSWVRFTTEAGESIIINAYNVRFPNMAERSREAFDAEQKAIKDYRAVVAQAAAFVGLDLSKPLEVGRTQQHSYSDSSEATYAVNPEATDADITAVINVLDPSGSSWGALRWSGGSSLVSRPAFDRVVIRSTTCLCD